MVLHHPLSWWNWDVDALVTAISNENQMTLCINGDSVLSVYTITGENRDSRSRMGRRLVLRRQTTTVYAGEVFEIAPITAWMRTCCAAASISSWVPGTIPDVRKERTMKKYWSWRTNPASAALSSSISAAPATR